MGSGHFLVSLGDWLADRVLEAMAEASAAVDFAPYVSPLADRIETIRARILAEAKAHGWPVAESQLDDRRSEEHTSELQSLMRSSYAVFCLKKKNTRGRRRGDRGRRRKREERGHN